jgi:Flp pilus assembly pilin Flp
MNESTEETMKISPKHEEKPVRARRIKGATTVEWVVLAMIIGVAMIAVWQGFKGKIAQTLDQGGAKITALGGG